MQYDATLKKLFRRPPNRLLAYALGFHVVIQRALPTEQIVIGRVHPDLLLETNEGRILHLELQGYTEENFAVRNLLYFALVLRDYERPPEQIAFWTGDGKVGVAAGLNYPPALDYRFRLIDLQEMDPEFLIDSDDPSDWVFAILGKHADARRNTAAILRRLATLPPEERREAMVQLLILSGLRGLKPVVQAEVKRMPIAIDIHENEFLEEIFQEGRQEGSLQQARRFLAHLLGKKFGEIPAETSERIAGAGLAELEQWAEKTLEASDLNSIFN